MIAGNPIAGFRRAMRHRHYRNYTVGSVLSLLGTWTQRVALGWLTWQLTHSYAWLGIISFADLFATLAVTPLAGEHSDRMNRQKLAMWSQVAMMLQAATIAVLVLSGLIEIWTLFGLTLALGVMHGYHSASRLAMVPNLVPPEDLTPAIAINSMIFSVARFVGPAIAGLIIVNFGVGAAFAFNAVTFVQFIIVLQRLTMLRTEHRPGPGKGTIANIGEGARYALGHAGIGPLLIMLAITAFASRSVPDMLPGFADGLFGQGPEGLAWLTSMMGLGAMLAGFVFLARDGVAGGTSLMYWGLVGLGVVSAVFALAPWFWLATALITGVGFFMSLNSVGALNLMQNAVDGAMRGRVMSMYSLLYQGAPAIGTLLIGAVAERTGLRAPLVAAGLLAIATAAWMWGRLSPMRGALEVDPPRPAAATQQTGGGS